MGIVSTLISFAMELSTIFATYKDKDPREMIDPITDAIIQAVGFCRGSKRKGGRIKSYRLI